MVAGDRLAAILSPRGPIDLVSRIFAIDLGLGIDLSELLVAVSHGGAARDDEPVLVIYEHILDGYFERVVHKGSTATRVLHDLIRAAVLPRDRVLARYMPHDVVREHVGKRAIVAVSSCPVLIAEQLLVRVASNERQTAGAARPRPWVIRGPAARTSQLSGCPGHHERRNEPPHKDSADGRGGAAQPRDGTQERVRRGLQRCWPFERESRKGPRRDTADNTERDVDQKGAVPAGPTGANTMRHDRSIEPRS